MGLFTKDVPLNEYLAPLVHPPNAAARKQVAKQQDAILKALAPVEANTPTMIAAAKEPYNVVAVITGERLLVFRDGRLERAVDIGQVSDAAISPGPYGTARATATPGLDFCFNTFEDANAFLVQLDRRDIPLLYPEYYTRILAALGYRADPENMLNLIQRVAQTIWAAGANAYFAQTGEADGKRAFEQRFEGDHGYDQWLSLPDEMIDWLWNWSANFHPPLRGLVSALEQTLTGEHGDLRGHDKFPSMDGWNRSQPGS